jgi:hypothetical protein
MQATSLDEWRAAAAAAAAVHGWSDERLRFSDMRDAVKAEAAQIDMETCQRFITEWKLPNLPSPSICGPGRLPSANLSSTDRLLLGRIKTALRRQGEGKVCWACGLDSDACRQLMNARGEPIGKGLAAHEFWDWDDERHVRTMTAIRFLCFDCHFLAEGDIIWTMTSLPNEYGNEMGLRRIEKFCTVNQCTLAQMMAQVRFARDLFKQRGKVSDWQVDLLPVQGLIEQANLRRGHPRKPRG